MWSQPSDPDQPRDIGHAMGYLIVEAFYHNTKNKAEAVREILGITNYVEFLERSQYAARFDK